METLEPTIRALQTAIPGFECENKNWKTALHSSRFCWSFDWTRTLPDKDDIHELNQLVPLKKKNITLSIDHLFDEEGLPLDEFASATQAYKWCLSALNEQLKEHYLKLHELVTVEQGVLYAGDTTRLICTTLKEERIIHLNAYLRPVGLAVI